MKKIYTLILFCSIVSIQSNAQNILFEDFESDSIDYIVGGLFFGDPQGPLEWLNIDVDGVSDENARPQDWFRSQYLIDTNNICLASSSWLTGLDESAENWLILPQIFVPANSHLIWKSAPRQGPRFLDGYQVLISTGTNLDIDFTDTLAVFAENTGWTDEWDTTTYTFSSGIMHPDWQLDTVDMDTTRLIGVLHEWDYDLSAYEGQAIYIAFRHRSADDNLIYIDDVTVTGVGSLGIDDKVASLALNIYPNPAVENIQMDYYINKTSQVTFEIYDQEGKLVDQLVRGVHFTGNHHFYYNVSNMATGNYFITMRTASDVITRPFVVTK